MEERSYIDTQTARGFIEQARTGKDLAYQDEIELWLAEQLLLTEPTSLEILLEGGHSFRDGATSERFSRLARRALRELYLAICKKDKRYSASVAQLGRNSELLVAAVAGYVAHGVGIDKAVVLAVVASVFNFACRLGIGSLCAEGATYFESGDKGRKGGHSSLVDKS